MANRRQIIQGGLTFSAVAMTGPVPWRLVMAAPEGQLPVLDSFVADLRFAESVAAASTMRARGVEVEEVSGDMTQLWINRYSRQWRQQPMTLAGVTGRDAFFVLETLAPDFGMRVVHKAVVTGAVALPGHAAVELVSWIIVPRAIAPKRV